MTKKKTPRVSSESLNAVEEKFVTDPSVVEKDPPKAKPKAKKLSPYTVVVEPKILSCRKTPSEKSVVINHIYRGEKLVIIEEHTDASGIIWGRPKVKIGWVKLDYCKKAGY